LESAERWSNDVVLADQLLPDAGVADLQKALPNCKIFK
jgi:hypothetical protein